MRLTLTLFQLVNKHNGINKVVKIKKKIEIPSIAKVKFKFQIGSQENLVKNCKEHTDLLKKAQTKSDPTNEKHAEFKAIIFNNFSFFVGINNKTPTAGHARI